MLLLKPSRLLAVLLLLVVLVALAVLVLLVLAGTFGGAGVGFVVILSRLVVNLAASGWNP